MKKFLIAVAVILFCFIVQKSSNALSIQRSDNIGLVSSVNTDQQITYNITVDQDDVNNIGLSLNIDVTGGNVTGFISNNEFTMPSCVDGKLFSNTQICFDVVQNDNFTAGQKIGEFTIIWNGIIGKRIDLSGKLINSDSQATTVQKTIAINGYETLNRGIVIIGVSIALIVTIYFLIALKRKKKTGKCFYFG